MNDRLTRANALIAESRAKLEGVLSGDAWPEIKSAARSKLRRYVEVWDNKSPQAREGALADLGPNGAGPGIDDIVSQAEQATLAMAGREERRRAA